MRDYTERAGWFTKQLTGEFWPFSHRDRCSHAIDLNKTQLHSFFDQLLTRLVYI